MINENFIILKRIGYGANFNKISIDQTKNLIKKECISAYGEKKINCEIKFYKFIIEKSITFKLPKIFSFQENGYIMEYLKVYQPLYKCIYYLSEFESKKIVNKIYLNLKSLHGSYVKHISREEYYRHLKIETLDKIQTRFDNIKNIIDKYSFIKKVNNVELLSFEFILSELNKKIYSIIEDKQDFCLVPIHGDCQFNNILYDSSSNDFIFIDPRGYYGDSEIFGIPEYDFAKILFALSGYDEFDNRSIDNLNITHDNITIKLETIDSSIFESNNLETLLMYTIWLGNAECFIKNNESKGVYSYFIGLYLGTLFLKK
jgi:hypothetical protein